MAEINFEQLIAAASKPEVGANIDKAANLMDASKAVLDKAEAWIQVIDRASAILERTGALPGLLRIAGKQAGNVDVDTPLGTSRAIMPASDAHKQVMDFVNGTNPADLNEVAGVLSQWAMTKKQARIEDNNEADKSGAGTA